MTALNFYGSPYVPDLSSAEKYVYTFLLEHREARSFSIRQLASAAHVSTATIIRLAHKFGYSGFADFHEDLFSRYTHSDELTDTDSRILLSDFLENTSLSISFLKSLQDAAAILNRSRSVLFVPDSSSAAACEYGIALFRQSGFVTSLYEKKKKISASCAIVICCSSSSQETDALFHSLQNLRIPLIGIFCAGNLCKEADVSVCCFEGCVPSSSTMIPAIAVLEELYRRI